MGRPVGELKLDDAEVQITLGTKKEEWMVEGSQSGPAQKFLVEEESGPVCSKDLVVSRVKIQLFRGGEKRGLSDEKKSFHNKRRNGW